MNQVSQKHNLNLCQPSQTWMNGSFAYVIGVNDRLVDGVMSGKDRVNGNHFKLTP